ncbi:hypothetical protein GGH99_000906 [Coemansia sp. RSA 1285]|nr:hypothetical protein GGH99_000906 [Coemansia sp. RSA 1285]
MEKQQQSHTPPEKSESFSAADAANSDTFASQSSASGPGASMYGGSAQQDQHRQAAGETDSSYGNYGQASADNGDTARGGNFFGSKQQQQQQQPYPPYSSSSASSSPYPGGYPPSGGGAPYSSGYPPQSYGGYPPSQQYGNGNNGGGYHGHQGPGNSPPYGVYPPPQHSQSPPLAQYQAGGPSNYYNNNSNNNNQGPPNHQVGAGTPSPPTPIRLHLVNPKSIPSGFTVVMPEGIYMLARRPNKVDKEKWGEFVRQLNEELAKSPGSLAHGLSSYWIVNLATLGVASIAREALKSKALSKSLKLAEFYNRAEFATWGIRVTIDVALDHASVAATDSAGGSSGGLLSIGHRENRAARRAERRRSEEHAVPDILVTLVISRSD